MLVLQQFLRPTLMLKSVLRHFAQIANAWVPPDGNLTIFLALAVTRPGAPAAEPLFTGDTNVKLAAVGASPSDYSCHFSSPPLAFCGRAGTWPAAQLWPLDYSSSLGAASHSAAQVSQSGTPLGNVPGTAPMNPLRGSGRRVTAIVRTPASAQYAQKSR